MISVVSFAVDSKRHFLRASIAELTKSGLPPTTFVVVTRPSAEIVVSILTLPVTFIRFASGGYSGTTSFFTLRFTDSVAASWA